MAKKTKPKDITVTYKPQAEYARLLKLYKEIEAERRSRESIRPPEMPPDER